MASLPVERHSESPADSYPLLMERPETTSSSEHVIDITRGTEASVSALAHDGPLDPPVGLPSSALRPPSAASAYVPSSNSSTLRRGNSRRHRSPLNSGLWICIELLLTISQIVASIVVLALSKHEDPHAPLRSWIVGYASGCFAVLPLLYWRYRHRNQSLEQESGQNREISVQGTLTAGTRLSLSFTRPSAEDSLQTIATTDNAANGGYRYFGRLSDSRLKAIMEYFKMGLDCFFAIWFVVGNVWIFGGSASSSDAPNLYRLCIVFLAFSCIGYAMPFILCATICCCLPCIISVLGFREDLNQTRGATSESINALPTYKFKLKKNKSGSNRDGSSRVEEGGIVAAGTDKERVIPAEDAACCICLAKYANNDELREMPCSHFLHKDCVDKWLKINATCPLCKCEVGASVSNSNASQGLQETGVVN
uniref:RING-type domain-containing protein n=1 Tax=Kalanchoe fedtschenkoi TaxID=63787 RepID=A0A7N0U7P2_KALFE